MLVKSLLKNSINAVQRFVVLSVISTLLATTVFAPLTARALVNNPAPSAQISFTFDDGFQSNYTEAAPTLAKYGFSGTSYLTTDCIGMTTYPNSCRADQDASYLTWQHATELQNSYGWEIGSHTKTHPYMASYDADDGQPEPLTPEEVVYELAESKRVLNEHGFEANAYASPYGDYSPFVLSEVAKYYSSHRGFAETGYNSWPHSDYYIVNQQVQMGVSVETVKSYVDYAVANNYWLVLTFHDIQPKASQDPDDYEYATADLDEIASYVQQKNASVVNVSDALVQGENLLPDNGSFSEGLSSGWTTDAPQQIYHDSNNNGGFGNPASSVKLTSGSGNGHLFSPRLDVSSETDYILKNYLSVQAINSGEIGFYIDEYDQNGNWISGQWKTKESSVFTQNLNFSYTPSSDNVAEASLQIYVTANSGVVAYIDNVQWLATSKIVEPPALVELLDNGDFNSGISAGWTTNIPGSITADSANNGDPLTANSQQNSVRLSNSLDYNRHLFSPSIPVSNSSSYSISNYLNLIQINSGEVGYYIDEYDQNGNWISGQYKGGARSVGVSQNQIDYTPSSANVASASFQVIVMGGSANIVGFLDNVSWIEN